MKRIIAVLVSMFFLSFIVSPLNATTSRIIYEVVDEEGINVRIEAPFQAYPNDTMTIRIRVMATEDLQDVTVRFKIYGSQSEGYTTWFRQLKALENRDLLPSGTVEDQHFGVDIPDDVDPGLLHGHIYCSWKVWRESSWQEQSIVDVCIHRVTYLKNKPYEELQVAYNQLLADYNALLSSYSALQANYSALQTDYNQLLADYNSLQNSYDDLEDSYSDLQAYYGILEGNYSTLLMNHEELQSSFNSLQKNYDSLNSTYHQLLSNHSSLQTSFNGLQSKYEFGGEIANTLTLMYVFIETTVIFIATTMYYARSQIYSALKNLKPKEQEVVDVSNSEEQQT